VGILSDIKRKSLPAIASSLGLKNEQGLLHFMTDSPWELKELEKRRLNIIVVSNKAETLNATVRTDNFIKRRVNRSVHFNSFQGTKVMLNII
jgi:SRSO17 transposase